MSASTIPGLVAEAARRFGPAEAVADGERRMSFEELADLVTRGAAACVERGLMPGDRVGVWAPNGFDWIVAALGALSAGGVLVPLNTRYKAG